MVILFLSGIAFLGGLYVGVRWSEKLKEIWYSIVSK
jgi:hypothetical protein